MFEHQDVLHALNGKLPLPEKVELIHDLLKTRFDFISRISVAVYDAKTDLLKTLFQSAGNEKSMALYSARLADSASLLEILKVGRPRVVNDLEIFGSVTAEHTRRIAAQQYKSSYTMPMYLNGDFFGFVFFNAQQKNVFDETVLHYLDMVGHLLSLLVIHDLSITRSLLAIVRTAANMAQHRDYETGAHLDRMSNYARLIANEVAKKYRFDDEIVERIFQFSPLHDIGKIGISDGILLKPGKLTGPEFDIMKTHAAKGGEIIDMMLGNLGMGEFPHAEMLRNIALYHHEAINGSGYNGLTDEEIPVEAKIVAVADVFDALTSSRPYKKAWSNDEAFAFLQSMAGSKFDIDCVAALVNCRDKVEAIQKRFQENHLG
ncbi:MAG: HD domain-containing protein [Nitrosomonadales bacterium]|nr:HD domain-containing protein [Nitrosomonadales bacterium]